MSLSYSHDVEHRRLAAGDPFLAVEHVGYLGADIPTVDPEILGRLSKDYAAWVRRAVARNPSSPPELLLRMQQDEPYEEIITAAMNNPNYPRQDLTALSRSGHAEDRRIAAANFHSPPEIIERLLSDLNSEIALTAAANPNLPRHVLAMWQLARG